MDRRDFMGASVGGSLLELMDRRQRANTFPDRSRLGRVFGRMGEQTAAETTVKHRLYAHLVYPRGHPDYFRRHIRPPDWGTFEHHTHFITLRDFDMNDGMVMHYAEKIAKYTRTYELGDVVWPFWSVVMAKNLNDVVEEIKRHSLFLFDIWGYVPGSAPNGFSWGEFRPPQQALGLFESELGDRWLGMDNGEQDGRYIGGYASQFYPEAADHVSQYLNFQRHFERLTEDLGGKMAALVSLNFGHYFLKEGVYTLIGAETAQGLPNGQVFYAFVRGAGKQYGVLWFGNASVYNRWGHKVYGSEGPDSGPTRGTSLSLMKRLMYSHILYNAALVGFENGWFVDNEISSHGVGQGNRRNGELSPIGHIQQAARRWVRQVGQPGVMLTPIAVMLDFYAGWTFPRHLYTENLYRVWGNLPYGPGDYLTDGVLDMLYPGYENSSYFHDESGFLSPTPYGDVADCILSDAEAWLLAHYPMLVVAGELQGGMEIRDKFEGYIEGGGHLVITAGNLEHLPGGVVGIRTVGGLRHFGPGQKLNVGEMSVVESDRFDLHPLAFPTRARIIAESDGMPAAIDMTYGEGRITVLASPFGVGVWKGARAGGLLTTDVRKQIDTPLAKPYPLLKHVQALLDQAFRAQMLFEVSDSLSLLSCYRGSGEYTLGVANNSWHQQPLKIVSYCGPIESIRELPLDQAEKSALGYLPEGFERVKLGVSSENTIAGGDIRIFVVRVRGEHIEEIPHQLPPHRPEGRFLTLRSKRIIKEEVLARPTFFEHFDGVVVDWKYFEQRTKNELEREAGWIGRQKLRVVADLTSGINLYPDLRLINNIPADYSASMEAISDLMGKMEVLRATDIILSLHRSPENNWTNEQTWKSFETTLRRLCTEAGRQKMALHLRVSPGKPPSNLEEAIRFVKRVGAVNLRLAPSTALMLARAVDPQKVAPLMKNKVGLWLVSTPRRDAAGVLWNANASVTGYKAGEALAEVLAIAPRAPIVLDALYKNQDEEYSDIRAVTRLLQSNAPV